MTTASHPVTILGTGSYAPERVMTNEDLSQMVDTSDEWITTRTGIRERHIAADGETASDMAVRAARLALDSAGLTADAIDAVIVCTMTPDQPCPATACFVQEKLGLEGKTAFDLTAACSGFIYGLQVASALVHAGTHRHVLLIGAEKLSAIIDWTDRSTCVLFGDGAGAVVLGRGPDHRHGIIGVRTGANGAQAELLHVPGGGCRIPASEQTVRDRLHFLKMNGREVFKHAVRGMEQVARDLLDEHGYVAGDLDLVIPHQANLRIIDTLGSRLEIPPERFFNNLERYGNTSAASIPLALDEAVRAGRVRPGDLILMLAFGAGLTWGASLLRWSGNNQPVPLSEN
ncbi:MAG: ketoacyl-ACP synthase III [Verrucomicrobia bacterium]|nr:MAG: ketoacyl-ACP synthase III [Verrucomicrobiota bacterium]